MSPDSQSHSDSGLESIEVTPSTTLNEGRKWINALLVLGAIIVSISIVQFVEQLVEWFDLESKFSYVNGIAQGIGICCGILSFVLVLKNKPAMKFLEEVFIELHKVVWANRDETTRLTFMICIAVAITSIFLGFLDYVIGKGLNLLY